MKQSPNRKLSNNGYQYVQRPSFRNIDLANFKRFRQPTQEQVGGEIRIGYLEGTKIVFGISRDEMTQNMLEVGRSGTGKTNLQRVIQLELHRLKNHFLIIDVTKPGGRFVKKYIPELRILRIPRDFIPDFVFPPPGASGDAWRLEFSGVTGEVFDFGHAAKSAFVDIVDSLHLKHDSESTGIYPNIFEIHETVETMLQERSPTIQKDTLRRIRNKTKAIVIALGKESSGKKCIPLENLLSQFVCIELMGLAVYEIQIWTVSMMLARIVMYRFANGHFGKLKHVVFFDEAAKIFS